MNDIFDPRRFARVFANDLLALQLRRFAFASCGLIGFGFFVHLASVSEGPTGEETAMAFAAALLFIGGAIFTSMVFNDMHHPLERYHYLMLPCSNLERFVSRYLVSAPLYVLYALLLHKVFEVAANFVFTAWRGFPVVTPLDLGSPALWELVRGYFIVHLFVFLGAIWFRSYALIKTMFAGFVFWSLFGLVCFLAVRTMYWDAFISLFDTNPDGPYINFEFLAIGEDGSQWYHKLLFVAFLGWFLFLAWLGLKEHEVQGGL